MRISSTQLRTIGSEFVSALQRGESVEITYHGKVIGITHPLSQTADQNLGDLDFFGMHKDLDFDTDAEVRKIRKGRDFSDL